MKHRLLVIVAVVGVLIGALAPTAIARTPKPVNAKDGFHHVDISGIKPHLDMIAGANPAKEVTVVVGMAGQPASEQIAAAKANGKNPSKAERTALTKNVKASIAPTVAKAQGLGAKVNQVYGAALVGFSARVPANKVDELANLPGVTSIQLAQKYTPDNERSVPFIGAPAAWGDYGFTGNGVKVGDIDTGIDYYHANFGGSGDPNDFANDNGLTIGTSAFPECQGSRRLRLRGRRLRRRHAPS